LDQPEGREFYYGQTSQGKSEIYYVGGDGHTAQKVQHIKESEDSIFKFVFTWLEGDKPRGWTIHYNPRHKPISAEVESAFSFLQLQQFPSCQEFDFDYTGRL